jgi:hypothetical protein
MKATCLAHEANLAAPLHLQVVLAELLHLLAVVLLHLLAAAALLHLLAAAALLHVLAVVVAEPQVAALAEPQGAPQLLALARRKARTTPVLYAYIAYIQLCSQRSYVTAEIEKERHNMMQSSL